MKHLPHIPVPKKGLNLGFTHVCQRCHAYWDGKMWSWDVSPAKNYCPEYLRHKEINLDNLKIRIIKAIEGKKGYRRAAMHAYKNGHSKLIITNEEAFPAMRDCPSYMVEVFNHEFLHWIICLLTRTEPEQYDRYLEAIGLYWHEYLAEEML